MTGVQTCALPILIGIALTSFNVYPVNLVFGFAGSALWAAVGLTEEDWPLFIVEAVAVAMYAVGMLKSFPI